MQNGAEWAFWVCIGGSLGVFASPLTGMFADRFFRSNRLLAFNNFAVAALLALCFFLKSPAVLVFAVLAVYLFYMPTWSLIQAIAMTHAPTRLYPYVRVFQPLGWVAGGVFSFVGVKWFGIADFDVTPWTFAAGAGTALAAALFAFCLPSTEPPAKGKPLSAVDAFGLRAFVLFKDPRFATLVAILFFSMIPFLWYMVYNAVYLQESGFRYITVTQNLSQLGEIGFTLLVPFVLARCGYKWTMVVGLGALAFRYVCFFVASAFGVAFLDFGGILMHGLVSAMLIVGASMFVNELAPAELRAQAQGLINLILVGAGQFASMVVFEALVRRCEVKSAAGAVVHNWPVIYGVALVMALVLMVAMIFCVRDKKGEG